MNPDKFAGWLKAARADRRMTQEDLAEQCAVSKGRVSQWETADIPTLENLVALANALRVDIREPLKVLGVLKDETIEVTPDERELLTLFRALPKNVDRVALDILQSLQQLDAGTAIRKPHNKRPATGARSANKAAS